MLYGEGHLGPSDSDEAVKWCRKAAEHGNASAQLRLGMMYEEGKSLPQDYREAVNWYRKAALQGDTAVCFSLGRMCEEGLQGILPVILCPLRSGGRRRGSSRPAISKTVSRGIFPHSVGSH